MFITEIDYKTLADPRALEIFQQSDPENRGRAERMAAEEIAGYLRNRYDTGRIFSAMREERNPLIVMYAMDITLYHLSTWLPQKMGFEIRAIRYKVAIEWLEKVQKGMVMPDLPCLTDPANGENDVNNPVRYGGMRRNKYDW